MRVTPLILTVAAGGILLANWPQAAGPDGTWRVHAPSAPIAWSVTLQQHIAWRSPLPNGGQSGIAVWGDRLFLTTFDAYHDGDTKFSGSILGTAWTRGTGSCCGQ